MKTLKLFVAAIALTFAIQVSANNPDPVKPSAELRSEIVQHLGPKIFFESSEFDITAKVLFTVNMNGEIIVISIESDNQEVIDQIKYKINYKKVSHRPTKAGEIYLMPVRVVNS